MRLLKFIGAVLVLGSVALCMTSSASDGGDGSVPYLVTPLPLDQQVCVGDEYTYLGDETIFLAIDAGKYNTGSLAKQALMGAAYTPLLQVAKLQATGEVYPFIEGQTTKACPYGCIGRLTYLGHTMTDVCVPNYLCQEGSVSDAYCDSASGNDIYYSFQTLFCSVIIRTAKVCGDGARCVQTADGPRCRTTSGYNGSQTGGTAGSQLATEVAAASRPWGGRCALPCEGTVGH